MPAPKPTPDSSAPPGAALTYADVGALLRCSAKSVVRLGAAVPGRFRVGRLVRFDRAAVLAWIAAGCPAGSAAK